MLQWKVCVVVVSQELCLFEQCRDFNVTLPRTTHDSSVLPCYKGRKYTLRKGQLLVSKFQSYYIIVYPISYLMIKIPNCIRDCLCIEGALCGIVSFIVLPRHLVLFIEHISYFPQFILTPSYIINGIPPFHIAKRTITIQWNLPYEDADFADCSYKRGRSHLTGS